MITHNKKDLMKKLGGKVKKFRVLAGFTQEKLAEMCDCSSQTISGIETGYSFPSFAMLVKLSEILEVPLAYFFESNFKKSNKNITQQLAEIFGNLSKEAAKNNFELNCETYEEISSILYHLSETINGMDEK